MTTVLARVGVWTDGSAALPGAGFGADPTTGIYRLADGTLGFSVGGVSELELLPLASAVNFLTFTPNTGTGSPIIAPKGTATNIGLFFNTKGTGGQDFSTGGTSNRQARIAHTASAVDYVTLTGATTTSKTVALGAAGSDANIGIAVVPVGTGALSAAVPDSTATGGNARGANAVDWQTARSAASAVASGTNSTVGGGLTNTASNTNATVAGGTANAASGASSAIGGGSGNSANGSLSAIAGGSANNVTAGAGWIPGGQNALTRGIHSGAWSAQRFSTNNGTAQKLEHVLRAATADATPTRLLADTSGGVATTSNSLPLIDGSSLACKIQVIARDQGSVTSAMWTLDALVERGTGVATVVVTGGGAAIVPTQSSGTGSAWRLAVAADTTNGSLAITGTGAAATSIRWVATILSAEVGAG